MINSIKLVRRGKVRRAKLYYLRGLRGKSARITEGTHHGGKSTASRQARPPNSPCVIAVFEGPACPALFRCGASMPDLTAICCPGRAGCLYLGHVQVS